MIVNRTPSKNKSHKLSPSKDCTETEIYFRKISKGERLYKQDASAELEVFFYLFAIVTVEVVPKHPGDQQS